MRNRFFKIKVEVYIEQMYSTTREKAITGEFTFVAIDDEKKPVKILIDKL